MAECNYGLKHKAYYRLFDGTVTVAEYKLQITAYNYLKRCLYTEAEYTLSLEQ